MRTRSTAVTTSLTLALTLSSLAGCGSEATPGAGSGSPGSAGSSVAAKPVAGDHTVATFEGTLDPSGEAHITFGPARAAGNLAPEDTIYTGVIAHTIGTPTFNSGTLVYSGSVDLISSIGTPLQATSAVIDSVSLTGTTNTGPWYYGDVAASGTSGTVVWSFTLPSASNLYFQGHVEGFQQPYYTAYEDQPKSGNQAWTGNLGLTFTVNSQITIAELGCFDANADGLKLPITVTIYNASSQTAVPGLQYTFAAGTGRLTASDRYQVVTPVNLPPGSYVIDAVGYGTAEMNYNSGPTPSITNTGGGKISFTGGGVYNGTTTPSFPTTVDGGPVNRYGAGTFVYY